jgi:aminoglycoside phosphotransferase (APT) family kinase protein
MEIATVKQLLATVPLDAIISRIIPLEKGFSTDNKFILFVDAVPTYLLRVSHERETERRQREFEVLMQLKACGIPCSTPYHFKAFPEFGVCLSLLGYLPGDCAEEALFTIDEIGQYVIGRQAGEILRRMHEVVTNPSSIDWPTLRADKYFRFLKIAAENDLVFNHQATVEQYVMMNQHLMQGRPVAFLHDDYHPGNLIILDRSLTGVIDFNRIDWGDPYHDFYKMAHFSAPRFPAFARGQVDGYFDGKAPDCFWPLYTLYVAMSLHSDLAWTQRFWPEQLNGSHQRVIEICKTHDFRHGTTPQWYQANA